MATRADSSRNDRTRRERRGRTREESAAEALARARTHARRALAEAIAAGRALLDATSLAVSGESSDTHQALSSLGRSLDRLQNALSGDASAATLPLVSAILEALDAEIGRWEERAADDSEARAVLRAFLGLREILWELGMRREGEAAGAQPRRRVQRVDVRG